MQFRILKKNLIMLLHPLQPEHPDASETLTLSYVDKLVDILSLR